MMKLYKVFKKILADIKFKLTAIKLRKFYKRMPIKISNPELNQSINTANKYFLKGLVESNNDVSYMKSLIHSQILEDILTK